MATATVTKGYATWVQAGGQTIYTNSDGSGDWSFNIGRGWIGYGNNDYDAAVVDFTVPSISDCLYGRKISIPVGLAYASGTTTSLYAVLSTTAPGSYSSFVHGPSSGIISNEISFNHSTTTLTFTINNGVSITGKKIYLYLYQHDQSEPSLYQVATSSFGNATLTYSGTYTLTVSVGDGGSVTVKRTSSAGGATGNLSSGAALYYGDVLQITYSVSTAYEVTGATVNGTDIVSGGSHTVYGNVKVVVSTKLFCLARIGNGSSYDMYLAYIGNGTSYDLYLIYIGNGTSWELYTGG